jgi:hypothetical protein
MTVADYAATGPLPTTKTRGMVPPLPGDATQYFDGSGNFSKPSIGGKTVTVPQAALTPTGTEGSLTFVNGVLMSSIDPT